MSSALLPEVAAIAFSSFAPRSAVGRRTACSRSTISRRRATGSATYPRSPACQTRGRRTLPSSPGLISIRPRREITTASSRTRSGVSSRGSSAGPTPTCWSRSKTSAGQAPGKDVLAALFPADEPTLLLLDEVLAYVEKAKALTVGESTLGSQVLLFLQALTELVGTHPRAAMVYSLQKSVLEAAGDESLLLALDHLVTRVDAKREPVTGDEVMRVVQRRLFADLGSEEERKAVAVGYADLYRNYRRQLAETEEQRRDADLEADRFGERMLPAIRSILPCSISCISAGRRCPATSEPEVLCSSWPPSCMRSGTAIVEKLPLIAPGDVLFGDEKVRSAFFSQVGDREGFSGVLERDLTGQTPACERSTVGWVGSAQAAPPACRDACCISDDALFVRRPDRRGERCPRE